MHGAARPLPKGRAGGLSFRPARGPGRGLSRLTFPHFSAVPRAIDTFHRKVAGHSKVEGHVGSALPGPKLEPHVLAFAVRREEYVASDGTSNLFAGATAVDDVIKLAVAGAAALLIGVHRNHLDAGAGRRERGCRHSTPRCQHVQREIDCVQHAAPRYTSACQSNYQLHEVQCSSERRKLATVQCTAALRPTTRRHNQRGERAGGGSLLCARRRGLPVAAGRAPLRVTLAWCCTQSCTSRSRARIPKGKGHGRSQLGATYFHPACPARVPNAAAAEGRALRYKRK